VFVDNLIANQQGHICNTRLWLWIVLYILVGMSMCLFDSCVWEWNFVGILLDLFEWFMDLQLIFYLVPLSNGDLGY